MDFSKRSYELELLDAEEIPKEDLYQNLRELAFINTYLGGHDVILAGLKEFTEVNSVLEIGSGGGDNLQALAQKCQPYTKLIGVDLKQDCTTFAQGKNDLSNIHFLTSDYRETNLEYKPDVIFNSLFCHHFTDDALVEMLKWMYENSEKGFFIGDLHRHALAYYSIKWLTRLFSKSHLVKNDAPLSVRRGFTKIEWISLLEKAEIKNYTITWKWAFRHLIVVKK
jgi:SAM-dependent methyltransferase